jgi:hypothetical protein
MGFLDWNLHTTDYWSDEMVPVRLPRHNLQDAVEDGGNWCTGRPRGAQASIGAAVEGRGVHSLDHRILRDDGSVMWVHAEGEWCPDATARPRFSGTLVDITARKQPEQQIRALNEELEARVRSRTRQLEAATRTGGLFLLGFARPARAAARGHSFAQIWASARQSLTTRGGAATSTTSSPPASAWRG